MINNLQIYDACSSFYLYISNLLNVLLIKEIIGSKVSNKREIVQDKHHLLHF